MSLPHGESVETILARIDERLGHYLESQKDHVQEFKNHMVDDKNNFEFLNKAIWTGTGGLSVLIILLKIIWK